MKKAYWFLAIMFFFLALCVIPFIYNEVNATPVLTVTDPVVFPCEPIDEDGYAEDADSAHVHVWHEDAADNAITYSARTDDMTAGWIGEVVYAGGKNVTMFRDVAGDIDAGAGDGNYTMVVYLFVDGQRFPTYYNFYLSGTNTNTAQDDAAAIKVQTDKLDFDGNDSLVIERTNTLAAVNTTEWDGTAAADADDGWVTATGFSTHNVDAIWDETRAGHTTTDTYGAGLDTLIGDGVSSSVSDADMASIADTILNRTLFPNHVDTTTVGGKINAIADSVASQGWAATSASSLDSGVVARVNKRMWGVQLGEAGSSDSLTFAQRSLALDLDALSTLTEDDNIGIDWSDVDSKNATVNLPATTISASQQIGQLNGNVTGTINGFTTAGKTEIADAVWDEDTTDHYDVGKYGYEAAQSGSGSSPWTVAGVDSAYDQSLEVTAILADVTGIAGSDGSAWVTATGFSDSGMVARINKRMWGLQLGLEGSTDSLTYAQRVLALDLDAIATASALTTHDSDIDGQLSTIQTDLDNPGQYKANVTNLDAAISTRSSHSAADAGAATWDAGTDDHETAGTFGEQAEFDSVGIAAIKAVTDQFGFTGGEVDAQLTAEDWLTDKSGYSLSANQSTVTIGTVNGFSSTAAQSLFDADTTGTNPAHDNGTYGRSLIDGGSGAGGGGSSASEIYDYFVADSREDEFKADVSGCAGGDGGGKTLVIWVADSSAHAGDTTDLALSGVRLTMMAEDQSQQHTERSSQANGFRSFVSTASTDYAFLSYASGYNFNAVDTVAVDAGVEPDTVAIYGYPFDPGSPGDPDLKRIFGWIYDPAGNALEGAIVTLTLDVPGDTIPWITSSGVTLYRTAIIDTTDANGYWSLDIAIGLTPAGCKYHYRATYNYNDLRRKTFVVPTNTTATNIVDLPIAD